MKIDLEIGDTILTGRFKNKPVEVKNIGTDDKGQPTINGRPALKFRIKKLMSKQEEQIRGIVREEIFNYISKQFFIFRANRIANNSFCGKSIRI